MPEGDSVYLLARRLDRALKGRRLARSDLRTPALANVDLAGRTVLAHDTVGKHLLTRLSDDVTLHTHLRMQGSWSVVGPGKRLPSRLMPDVRVVLEADHGPTAYGVLLPVLEVLRTTHEHEVVGHLGPDPLREDWDADEAQRRLAREPARPLVAALLDQRNLAGAAHEISVQAGRRAIGEALRDQRCIAGLGNLWVIELCFLRGVNPWTPVSEVDLPAMVRLAARALRTSVHVPGAYQVTTGNARRGEAHYVYGRAGKPCRRCGTAIESAIQGQAPYDRITYWCPSCQP